MTPLTETAFYFSAFSTGIGVSLLWVLWLIRKPIKPYDTDHMVDHSEQQRTIITRGDNITEI